MRVHAVCNHSCRFTRKPPTCGSFRDSKEPELLTGPKHTNTNDAAEEDHSHLTEEGAFSSSAAAVRGSNPGNGFEAGTQPLYTRTEPLLGCFSHLTRRRTHSWEFLYLTQRSLMWAGPLGVRVQLPQGTEVTSLGLKRSVGDQETTRELLCEVEKPH